MSSIGDFIVFIVYSILLVPPILIIIFLIFRKKRFTIKRSVYLVVAFIPLIFFGSFQYKNKRDFELKYVGIYFLTEYPNCDSCLLILTKDNSYSVTKNGTKIETGHWNYRGGGDFWIVDIGKNGQLGSGKFKYRDKTKLYE